jgi:hypothetical protein
MGILEIVDDALLTLDGDTQGWLANYRGWVKSMERDTQQQMVAINRGQFLVRYATAEDEERPPKVALAPDPVSTKDISFLLHPDHNEAVLWQPGSCLVVTAMAAGKLSVEVIPAHEGGSAAATVKIEPLSQGQAVPLSIPKKKRGSTSGNLRDFHILGHVTGIGDVTVNADEWIAGPSAPARIEGISVAWPGKPRDLELHYAVKTARPQPISGRKMDLGSFAGTRGKAMPIVDLLLELSGPGAENFQLSVEAIFLGSPALRKTGRRIVLSGQTGREPLVGLRLSVENVGTVARPPQKPSTSNRRPSEGRVRVFRSRLNQQSAAV